MSNRRVYVVNKGGHDFSAAKKYGEVNYLTEGLYSPYAVSSMYREFSLRLRESCPDDYILLTGPSVMCSIACTCFGFLHGRLNLLIFTRDGKYKERQLILGNLLSKGDGTVPEQIEDMIKET